MSAAQTSSARVSSRRLTKIDGGYVAVVGGEAYTVERHGFGWRLNLDESTAMTCRSLRQVRRILAAVDTTLAELDRRLSR